MKLTTFRRSLLSATVLTAAIVAAGCGSGDDATPAPTSPSGAPSLGQVYLNPDNGGQHIPTGINGSGYTEVPATSGPHWIDAATPAGVPAPARWGIYSVALPDEVLVHNLEHGGIGLHYNCPSGCADIVSQLESLVPSNPSQYIVSPYPNTVSRIVITAWRHSLYLADFDEQAIRDFIADHQDNAPESIRGNTF